MPSAGTAPRRGVPILAVAAVLALLAAVAGFLIGGSGSSSEPSTPDLANSASAGDLSLSFPAGWRRVTEAPNVPGMRFSQPIVLSPSGPRGARLNAGMVDASGPTLLPPGFRSRLSRQPPGDDRVKLGRLQAFRYADLEARGLEGRVTVYSAHASSGVATVACSTPSSGASSSFLAECEQVAGTLALTDGDPLALGPREDYAKAAGGAIGTLDRSVASGTRRLRDASEPDGQAAAATDLAKAYRTAARAMSKAPAGPWESRANSRMVASLREIGGAYERVARAARSDDGEAYSAAGRAVERGGGKLRRAQRELRRLGYSSG